MLRRYNLPTIKQSSVKFQPDFIAKSVSDINFTFLASHGIKACFIDLDGTVVARGQYDVDPAVSQTLRTCSMPIFIATNRPKSRALNNLKADLAATDTVHPHGLHPKPSKRYYRQALAKHNLQPYEVIMIGDRYIQDIWGANRAGLYSLVVHKTGASVGKVDQLLSKFEAFITARYSGQYRQL